MHCSNARGPPGSRARAGVSGYDTSKASASPIALPGVRKLIRTDAQTRAVPWVRDTPVRVVRGIGVLEILGALGVVLPALTGILPWLTPVAEAGLVLLMLGAAWVNYRAQLYRPIVANVVILLLAVILVYGRAIAAAS